MPVSVPGRDDRPPAGGRYRPRPGNGVPGPGFDAGVSGGGVSGPAGLGGGGPVEAGGGGLGDPRLGAVAGDGAGRSLVRPYAVTGGRTRPRTQLEIEAM